MANLASILIAVTFLASLVTCQKESCYSKEERPYSLFATKTSYFEVDNEEAKEIKVPGCMAKSFWTVIRHGTRNPGDKAINKIVERSPELRELVLKNHKEGRGTLCEDDLSGIRSWTLNLTAADKTMLTASGEEEQESIGTRWRQRLPRIVGDFDKEKHKFRPTIKQRAQVSAKAFARGAFPQQNITMKKPREKEPLLRFYDFCSKWEREIDKNNATYEEQRLFLESSKEMEETMKRVANRLGFEKDGNNTWSGGNFTSDDLVLMYDMCRYGKAFYPIRSSPWCAAFQKEDLEVIEYYQDLEYWYKNGYYDSINYKMSCPLIKDLYRTFSMNETDRPTGTFYFGHSESVIPFLGMFGLYNDTETPTHDNYEEMKNREYRTSLIGSFSANVAFVLFQCEEEPTMRIQMYHQEKEVKMGKCDQTLCDWQQFTEAYKNDIECHFNEICEVGRRFGKMENGDKEPKSEASKVDKNSENGVTSNSISQTMIISIAVGITYSKISI